MAKNKKNKARRAGFNIIDLVVILAVLSLIAMVAVAYFSDREDSKTGDAATLQYVIQSDAISEAMADNIAIGDAVFDRDSGREIGRIAAFDVRSAVHTGMNSEGVQVVDEIEGFRVLYITVEADAVFRGDKFTVSGVTVSAGAEYKLMMKNLY